MAWRSGGTNNDEMVNNLKRFGVIHSPEVEHAFRVVDRRFFVPRNLRNLAHADEPLREGRVHISAPHIYGSVVEALELPPNRPMSFLNIGSGTGYISSIAAQIMGPTSTQYGVELHAEVLEHCEEAMAEWQQSRVRAGEERPAHVEILHGNGLNIDGTQGEALVGLDRIYIGAAIEKNDLAPIAALLKPGGILVGPVGDELVKVVRVSTAASDTGVPDPPRSFRGQPPSLSSDFSLRVISGVRFSPLVPTPAASVVLPSRVWSPDVHAQYPQSFRKACKQILLCSQAADIQPIVPKSNINAAAMLPRALWMEILSYTRRDWFEEPRSEEALLRRRLREEQAAAQRAQEARLEAETRLHMAERERDIYRVLALRWQRRLQAALSERGRNVGNMDDDDILARVDDVAAAAAGAGDEPLVIRLGGLGAMLERFQADSDEEDDDAEEADDDQDHAEMEDATAMSEDAAETMQEASEAHDEVEPMALSPATASALAARPQMRTVSITSEDL